MTSNSSVRGHAVYDDGVLRITRAGSPPVLALVGEIDESTYAGLVGALAEFTAGQGEIHLDLAGVDYCDLAGLRALVRLTGADGRDPGRRRVALHSCPAQLTAVLSILGWDTTVGLTFDEQASGGPARPGSSPARLGGRPTQPGGGQAQPGGGQAQQDGRPAQQDGLAVATLHLGGQ
jgi:ABC-type transporter Mla MlaB component